MGCPKGYKVALGKGFAFTSSKILADAEFCSFVTSSLYRSAPWTLQNYNLLSITLARVKAVVKSVLYYENIILYIRIDGVFYISVSSVPS